MRPGIYGQPFAAIQFFVQQRSVTCVAVTTRVDSRVKCGDFR